MLAFSAKRFATGRAEEPEEASGGHRLRSSRASSRSTATASTSMGARRVGRPGARGAPGGTSTARRLQPPRAVPRKGARKRRSTRRRRRARGRQRTARARTLAPAAALARRAALTLCAISATAHRSGRRSARVASAENEQLRLARPRRRERLAACSGGSAARGSLGASRRVARQSRARARSSSGPRARVAGKAAAPPPRTRSDSALAPRRRGPSKRRCDACVVRARRTRRELHEAPSALRERRAELV